MKNPNHVSPWIKIPNLSNENMFYHSLRYDNGELKVKILRWLNFDSLLQFIFSICAPQKRSIWSQGFCTLSNHVRLIPVLLSE